MRFLALFRGSVSSPRRDDLGRVLYLRGSRRSGLFPTIAVNRSARAACSDGEGNAATASHPLASIISHTALKLIERTGTKSFRAPPAASPSAADFYRENCTERNA